MGMRDKGQIEEDNEESTSYKWNRESKKQSSLDVDSLFRVRVLDDHDDDAVGELVDEAHEAVDESSSFDVAADEISCDGERSDEEGGAPDAQQSRHQEDAPLAVVGFAGAKPHPNAAAQTHATSQREGPL